MLIEYVKRVLWGGAVRLSYIQDAWCLKVNGGPVNGVSDPKSGNSI